MISEFRTELLHRHSELLAKQKSAYEQTHGPLSGPGEFFRLVTSHPDFQHLRPLSEAIVQIDEAVENDRASDHAVLEATLREKLCDFLKDGPSN